MLPSPWDITVHGEGRKGNPLPQGSPKSSGLMPRRTFVAGRHP